MHNVARTGSTEATHTTVIPLIDTPAGVGPDGAGTHEATVKGMAELLIALHHGGSVTISNYITLRITTLL